VNQRDELKLTYKMTRRPSGVYQIRNTVTGRVLLGCAHDCEGLLRRHQFELKLNGHRVPELQADWNQYGPDAFAFEIVEFVKPEDELTIGPKPTPELMKRLDAMLEAWMERVQPYGERGYHKR